MTLSSRAVGTCLPASCRGCHDRPDGGLNKRGRAHDMGEAVEGVERFLPRHAVSPAEQGYYTSQVPRLARLVSPGPRVPISPSPPVDRFEVTRYSGEGGPGAIPSRRWQSIIQPYNPWLWDEDPSGTPGYFGVTRAWCGLGSPAVQRWACQSKFVPDDFRDCSLPSVADREPKEIT